MTVHQVCSGGGPEDGKAMFMIPSKLDGEHLHVDAHNRVREFVAPECVFVLAGSIPCFGLELSRGLQTLA
jgi:hypothetical protein